MKRIIFIISFFAFSGYYAGLVIIFSLGLQSLSRFYSVPLKVLMAFLMLIVLQKYRKKLFLNKHTLFLFLFVAFWILYAFKVITTEIVFPETILSKEWYEFILYSVLYVFIPFITFYSLDFNKYKKVILSGFISSGLVLGVLSTYFYGKLLGQGLGRISMSVYQTGEQVISPLVLSYAGALTLTLSLYQLFILKGNTKFQKLYLYSSIGFSFVMFLLGSSRGSVIALMLTLPLFILYSPLKQKIWLTFLGILSTPIVIWAIEASGSNIFDRLSNTAMESGSRSYLWSKALSHFSDYPFIGGKIEIGGIYPHNIIIEILMATGVVGAFLILPVIFKGFKLGIINAKHDKTNLYILLIMVQGLTQHLFTGGFYTSTLLFVPLGMILSLSNYNMNNSLKFNGN